MKKILLILSIVTFISCSSDDDAGDVITNEFERITSVLSEGTWEVTKLIDDNDDRTIAFESFTFTFNQDGTVVSETDLFSETGTWFYKSTSQDGEQLVLEFSDITPFDEISDDWEIVSLTNSQVELTDTGDTQGDTDFLVFTKL